MCNIWKQRVFEVFYELSGKNSKHKWCRFTASVKNLPATAITPADAAAATITSIVVVLV